jgi:hypothetical protein
MPHAIGEAAEQVDCAMGALAWFLGRFSIGQPVVSEWKLRFANATCRTPRRFLREKPNTEEPLSRIFSAKLRWQKRPAQKG